MTSRPFARWSMRWRVKQNKRMMWQLIGSVIGVLAIAALVWYLGLGQAKLTDAAQAQRLAEDMVSGFKAGEVILSDDNEAALIFGEDNSFVLLKRHGAKFAARRLKPPLKFTQNDKHIEIDSGEITYGKISLILSAAKAETLADRLLTSV